VVRSFPFFSLFFLSFFFYRLPLLLLSSSTTAIITSSSSSLCLLSFGLLFSSSHLECQRSSAPDYPLRVFLAGYVWGWISRVYIRGGGLFYRQVHPNTPRKIDANFNRWGQLYHMLPQFHTFATLLCLICLVLSCLVLSCLSLLSLSLSLFYTKLILLLLLLLLGNNICWSWDWCLLVQLLLMWQRQEEKKKENSSFLSFSSLLRLRDCSHARG